MAIISKIYMDACCYIDIVQGVQKEPKGSQLADHCWVCEQFLDAALKGRIQLFGSFLMVVECTHVKKENLRKDATDQVKAAFNNIFISGKIMTPIQPTPKIINYAREITWTHGLYLDGMDAIHLATAKLHDCGLFITRDRKILGLSDDIKLKFGIDVCQGQEAISWLPAEYRNKGLFI